MSTKRVDLVVLGCGTVGKAFLRLVQQQGASAASPSAFAPARSLAFRVVATADSSAWVVNRSSNADAAGLDIDALLAHKAAGQSFSALSSPQGPEIVPASEEDRALAAVAFGNDTVVVDCTSSTATLKPMNMALAAGGASVMANKKPVSGPQSDFDQLTQPSHVGRVGMESTVGAGSPFVASMKRLVQAGDSPTHISGTFSGTLGYITAGLEQPGSSLSALVRDAYDKGYTEPDPRDDLSGTDVARKALILARIAGHRLELSDVQVEALFPSTFADLSVDEFLARLPELDDGIAERVAQAKSSGQVLRYVATVEDGRCSVGLRAVAADSPIGRLKGTDNICTVSSAIYSDSPLVIQGSGAGPEITAAGIMADIVSIMQGRQ